MWMNKTWPRTFAFVFIFMAVPTFLQSSKALAKTSKKDPMVIQVMDLGYADCAEVASVLSPFLSAEGRISVYGRTNSLIIMDKASIVRRLVELVKGPLDQQP